MGWLCAFGEGDVGREALTPFLWVLTQHSVTGGQTLHSAQVGPNPSWVSDFHRGSGQSGAAGPGYRLILVSL